MKHAIFAAVFLAACASNEPQATQTAPQAPSAAAAGYADARSQASDADVRDARRAYRAACERSQSTAYCECMTGGMAQALAPADLAVATAALSGQAVQASQAVRDRVSATRTDVERGCMQFR